MPSVTTHGGSSSSSGARFASWPGTGWTTLIGADPASRAVPCPPPSPRASPATRRPSHHRFRQTTRRLDPAGAPAPDHGRPRQHSPPAPPSTAARERAAPAPINVPTRPAGPALRPPLLQAPPNPAPAITAHLASQHAHPSIRSGRRFGYSRTQRILHRPPAHHGPVTRCPSPDAPAARTGDGNGLVSGVARCGSRGG